MQPGASLCLLLFARLFFNLTESRLFPAFEFIFELIVSLIRKVKKSVSLA
jgi:hypothetical protein